MSSYYIEPSSEQLYYRYNGDSNIVQQEVNWMPVVVTIGVVAFISIGLYMSMEKQKRDISQLDQQQYQLSRISIINEHTLNNVKEDVRMNAKSIYELRREIKALKLQAELNNTIWC